MKLSGESASSVTSTWSSGEQSPFPMGCSHTCKHRHTFAHSLVMVMDSTRQSSDEDAGAREVNHFTQVVFHTERNQTSEASWKLLDTHTTFSSLLNTTQGWNFPGILEHRGIFPALLLTCYSSSAKICHTLGATSLGKAVLSLLGVFHPNPITCPTMPHLSISWQQEEPIRNHQPQCQDCKNPTSAQIQNATKNKVYKFVGGVEYQKSVIGKICSLLIFSCFDWCNSASSFLTHSTYRPFGSCPTAVVPTIIDVIPMAARVKLRTKQTLNQNK